MDFKVGDKVIILAHNSFPTSGDMEYMGEKSLGITGYVTDIYSDGYHTVRETENGGHYYGMYKHNELELASKQTKKEIKPMDGFGDIFNGVEKELNSRLQTVSKAEQDKLKEAANEQIEKIQALIGSGAKLRVTSPKGTKVVTGLKHKQLQTLIQMVGQRIPVLIVGMAGTGKTHAAEQVAEALKVPFYAMSVGAQTSKSDILGFIHAGGEYVPTLFRRAYEEGGVFLMDELDAGNANVLIQVNAALSNNYCAFPDGMVKRHKDFCFIATANTYGNGANRMYVGRNQLDAATLDRFAVLDWEVDETLEAQLVQPYEYGEKWHEVIKDIRKYVQDQGLRILVTPRATIRGVQLIDTGFTLEDAMNASLLNSVPADKQSVIKTRMLDKWGKDRSTNKKRNEDLQTAIVEPDIADIQF